MNDKRIVIALITNLTMIIIFIELSPQGYGSWGYGRTDHMDDKSCQS